MSESAVAKIRDKRKFLGDSGDCSPIFLSPSDFLAKLAERMVIARLKGNIN